MPASSPATSRTKVKICTPIWPPTARQREIAALLQRRAALVKHAVALEQSLSGAAFLKRETRRALAALRELVAAVERQLKALLAENPALEERRQRLQSIAGVGPLMPPSAAPAPAPGSRTSPTSLPKAFPRPLPVAHWPGKSRVAFAVRNSNTPFNPALLGKKVDNAT
ncbi:MAG: hypothetical protein ACHBNF_13185 [Chromatiales bacterium]